MAKFGIGSRVRHMKTGGEYVIEEGPERCRLESTGEPAYAYRGDDGILWVRAQSIMEDGRFVALRGEGHGGGKAPIAPAGFSEAASQWKRLLDRTRHYDWTDIRHGEPVPENIPCVVRHDEGGKEDTGARCIAFAVRKGDSVAWYGVKLPFHEPAELWGITGYVRVADIPTDLAEAA